MPWFFPQDAAGGGSDRLAASGAASAADISGAGATFPYPIYAKWADAYKQKTGTAMNYQSIGSGGGIKQITAKTVDFGASDMPLKGEQLQKEGLAQWPMVMGGVVPVVNLQGIQPGQLKLDGETLGEIYVGNITEMERPGDRAAQSRPEPARQGDRAGLPLRRFGHDLPVHRLPVEGRSRVQAEGRRGHLGAVPGGIGGKGNEGVAAMTGRTDGAIGYVEYAYALQNKMNYTQMKNRDGNFVAPDIKAFQAAAAGADWSSEPGFGVVLTNQPGNDSWPITGATFILMHKTQKDPQKAKQVLDFFDWAYRNGDQMARGAATMFRCRKRSPAQVEDMWKKEIVGPDGKPVWTGPARDPRRGRRCENSASPPAGRMPPRRIADPRPAAGAAMTAETLGGRRG